MFLVTPLEGTEIFRGKQISIEMLIGKRWRVGQSHEYTLSQNSVPLSAVQPTSLLAVHITLTLFLNIGTALFISSAVFKIWKPNQLITKIHMPLLLWHWNTHIMPTIFLVDDTTSKPLNLQVTLCLNYKASLQIHRTRTILFFLRGYLTIIEQCMVTIQLSHFQDILHICITIKRSLFSMSRQVIVPTFCNSSCF